jgi:hypothetical protein
MAAHRCDSDVSTPSRLGYTSGDYEVVVRETPDARLQVKVVYCWGQHIVEKWYVTPHKTKTGFWSWLSRMLGHRDLEEVVQEACDLADQLAGVSMRNRLLMGQLADGLRDRQYIRGVISEMNITGGE